MYGVWSAVMMCSVAVCHYDMCRHSVHGVHCSPEDVSDQRKDGLGARAGARSRSRGTRLACRVSVFSGSSLAASSRRILARSMMKDAFLALQLRESRTELERHAYCLLH